MDYLEYYGLNEEPFRLTPDPAYFFLARSHNEGLLSLNHSTEHKEGFCLVTGEPGTGKTTLLNVFIERWKERAEIAMILSPRLSPEDFLVSVLEDLGIEHPVTNKNEVLRTFRDFLIRKSAEGRFVIILVDEAQNLPDETLEELRLLSNMETNKQKLLQIVLIGQPELQTRLESDKLRQLNQRIVTRVSIAPLGGDEARDYIGFRLSKAGRGFVRFDNSAVKKIFSKSKGIPRLINTLATRSLMSAYLNETMRVKAAHVDYAAQSLNPDLERSPTRFRLRPVYLWASTVVVAFLAFQFVINVPLGLLSRPHGEGPVNEDSIPAEQSGVITRTGERQAERREGDRLSVETVAVPTVPVETHMNPKSDVELPLGYAPPSARPYLRQTSLRAIGQGRITSSAANIRKTPGMRGERLSLAYRDETLLLVDRAFSERGELWYLAQTTDGRVGWVAESVIEVSLHDAGVVADRLQ